MGITVVDVLIIAFLVESIVLHEIAHGWVALKFGDPTALKAGRLTFNPIPHIDLVWTIVIPIITYLLAHCVIGGAKPVPVNPFLLRRKPLSDICVSLAGVTVNFLIAVVMILAINDVVLVHPHPLKSVAFIVFANVALLNILLMFFNLIPIPPLDGSHVFKYLLPPGVRDSYEMLGRSGIGFIIIVILINIPVFRNVFVTLITSSASFIMKYLIFV